jgi:hypothetical protein
MLNNFGPMLNGVKIPYYIGLAGPKYGLGQIDPASLTLAITTAVNAWNTIKSALGIDAGSSEANIIVPVQNAVVNSVITPVSAFLTSVNNGTHIPTCQELQSWLTEVTQAHTNWENYLHNTQWKDGRAAQQADATLASYWTNATNDLNKYIGQYCGIGATGGILINPVTGQLNYTTIALIGVAAYFLMKNKK